MDHNARAETVHQELDKARPDYDDAAWACVWARVVDLGRGGLVETGIRVVDESRQEEAEEIEPLRYGWASTPSEVHQWAERYGLPLSWEQGKAALRFDGKPGPDIMAALKCKAPLFPGQESRASENGAGWSYSRSQKAWRHGCYGTWATSGKTAAFRAAVDEGATSYTLEPQEPEPAAVEGGAAW